MKNQLKVQKFKSSGTTLVEVVIYLALLVIVFGAIIQFAFSVMEANQNAKRRIEVQKTAIFVSNHIESTFNKVNSIDNDNSRFDIDNGKLRLYKAGNSYEYQLINGNLVFSYNGVSSNLNNRYVDISRFYLEKVSDLSGVPVGVRLTIVLRSPTKTFIQQTYETYYTLN